MQLHLFFVSEKPLMISKRRTPKTDTENNPNTVDTP
jgi:hypothetical protein